MIVFIVLSALTLALLLMWLVPMNRYALRCAIRPSLFARGNLTRRNMIPWTLSLSAIFAGPASIIVAPAALYLERGARKRALSVQYPDPDELHMLDTARNNAWSALAIFIAAICAAGFIAFWNA